MFIILEKHHKKQQNISCICTKAFTFKLGTGIQSYKFAAKKFQQSQARQPIELQSFYKSSYVTHLLKRLICKIQYVGKPEHFSTSK